MYNILIVDDISENIKIAISILENESYNFSYALNGREAIEIIKIKRFDLILLDIMMPVIDGFEVCKIIKSTPAIKNTPVIFLTAKIDNESVEEGFELGAVDYITKPFRPGELKARVKNHLGLYKDSRKLKASNINLFEKIKKTQEKHLDDVVAFQKDMILIFSNLLGPKNVEGRKHLQRVSKIAKAIGALDNRLDNDSVQNLHFAASLYDIGKLQVHESILNKKETLNKLELEHVRSHTELGYNILNQAQTDVLKFAAIIAKEHHENYDGSGYPRGLYGDDIHIFGRIVALADVITTLVSKRVYADAWSFEKMKEYIYENSGIKFEPKLVEIFKNNLNIFKKIIEE